MLFLHNDALICSTQSASVSHTMQRTLQLWVPCCCFSCCSPDNQQKVWNQVGISSVQSHSHVQLFVTPQAATSQTSLSIHNSRSLFKLISIASVMPSNPLILCHPLLLLPSIFPSIRVFSSESVLLSGDQSIRVSASASVLPMNFRDCFLIGLTGLISLLSEGLSRVFSNTTVQKHQFLSTQLSL